MRSWPSAPKTEPRAARHNHNSPLTGPKPITGASWRDSQSRRELSAQLDVLTADGPVPEIADRVAVALYGAVILLTLWIL